MWVNLPGGAEMKWLGVMVMALLLDGCSTYQYRATPSKTQYINLYNKDGTRKSYGTVTGDGYIQMFNPDGSRGQYGNVGR